MMAIDLLATGDEPREITQEQMPQQQELSLIDKLGRAAAKFNQAVEQSGLPQFAGGALGAPLHMVENVANFPGYIAKKITGREVIPHVKLPESIDPETYMSRLPYAPKSHAAGQLTGGLLALLMGSPSGVLPATTSLGTRAAVGAAEGAALSPDEYRGVGAGIGAALPLGHGLMKSTIGKRAGEMLEKAKGKSSELYNRLFKTAENEGLHTGLQVPSALKKSGEDIDKLFKHTETNLNSSVKRFANNPTLENAHKAQSDLGKIERQLQNSINQGKTLSSGQHDALTIAKDMKKRIRGSIQNKLTAGGRGDLAQAYSQATKDFAENVAPFEGIGSLSPKEAAKRLIASEKFAGSTPAKKLPGYSTRRAISGKPGAIKQHVIPHAIGAGGASLATLLGLGAYRKYLG